MTLRHTLRPRASINANADRQEGPSPRDKCAGRRHRAAPIATSETSEKFLVSAMTKISCNNYRPAMPKAPRLRRAFFNRSVHEAAPDLLGATLLVDGIGGTIVEVEAYDQNDPAAHGYRGRTQRNASMFGPPGHAYVYRAYGLHWCLNFVCEGVGTASAILIRAIEPRFGIPIMQARRRLTDIRLLCSGPGRVCEALGVTRAHDGLALDLPPFEILARSTSVRVTSGLRIGITKAADRPWRYGLAQSGFLSRPLSREHASVRRGRRTATSSS